LRFRAEAEKISMRTFVIVPVFLALSLTGCSSPRSSTDHEVRIAAAADLKFALEEAIAEFRGSHSDIQLKVSYGSSGSFYTQLSNGAPFDLFLSADMDYPRRLIAEGLADKATEFVYAVGHLVLWVPKESPLDLDKLGMNAAADPSVKKLAIANPRFAPYGRAADAALKKLGLYDQVKDRLVFGENIAQTAQYVETGAADAGLIALSLALAPSLRDKGRYIEVPLDAYPKLEQGGVILNGAADRQAAQAVRDFLASVEGKAVLKRYGFSLPGE
jgi:molybdate transport system substrate-binding protein